MPNDVNVKVLLDYKQYCRLKSHVSDAAKDGEEVCDKATTETASMFPILQENQAAAAATQHHLDHPGDPLAVEEGEPVEVANVVPSPPSEAPHLLGVVPSKSSARARELLDKLDITHTEKDTFILDGITYTREQLRWLFYNVFSPRPTKKIANEDEFLKSIKTRYLLHLINVKNRGRIKYDGEWWKV